MNGHDKFCTVVVQVDFRLSDVKLLKQNHLRLSEHIQLNYINSFA